jgi:hypothetical protein
MKCTYYTARLKICIQEVRGPCRYMVEFGTKLLEIHCTSAKEQQPQITSIVSSNRDSFIFGQLGAHIRSRALENSLEKRV